MQNRSFWVRGKILLVVVFAAGLAMACGEEDAPVILGDNECGGGATLEYDGEEAAPGDTCGDCGVLACDGGNTLTCEDPGANACGGCADLDEVPGGSCSVDGESGLYACEGGDEVVCSTEGVNVCGGSETLEADPGDVCGGCGLGSYQCAGPDAVECHDTVGCPNPSDVMATKGEHADKVVVTWRGSIYATGYRIYRDGEELTTVSPGRLSYTDEDADAAGGFDDIDVTASTDRVDGVNVEWQATDGEFNEHEYQVEIIFPDEESELSLPAVGYRGVDIDRYELSIDGGSWMDVGDSTEYLDEYAAMATVEDLLPSILDSGWDYLELIASPVIVGADEHEYVVRAITADGDETDSEAAYGYRSYDDETTYWSVSEQDSMDDADFEPLVDCDGDMTCLDDDFPVDSDVAEKYYRFTVDGDGIDGMTSDNFAASVDMLVVEPDSVESPVSANEAVDFSAQIVTPDGDPVARQNVELETEVSNAAAISEDPTRTVMTDADGMATVTYTFVVEAEDVTIDWEAVGDSRVDDAPVTQGPFDVEFDVTTP